MLERNKEFVFAYQWDHNCYELFESMKGKLIKIMSELGELDACEIPKENKTGSGEAGEAAELGGAGKTDEALEALEALPDKRSLLEYYKKWHYNRELFERLISTIDRKRIVINELGYRGYGVNIDLLNAMEHLKLDLKGKIETMLHDTFMKQIEAVKQVIFFPQERINEKNTLSIISELCWKLSISDKENT
ncbi:hypothetical protein MCHI_002710, partial [Candidatus Magnetoovum chiemensis]